MKAVIMAGGRGTRIRSVASDIPKPMIPVLGKPVLAYQIENLKQSGITEIILVTGYLKESIIDYFGNGERFGVEISYFNEDRAMGTAGSLYYLKDQLQEEFILLMGDLMLSVDFGRFAAAHKAAGAAATLFVHPNSHPFDSDLIVTDTVGHKEDFTEEYCGKQCSGEERKHAAAKQVTGFISKKTERNFFYHNQVNAGIYCLSPEALAGIPEPLEKVDLDKDIIRPLIGEGRVFAYSSTEYCKDMGTPERYEEVSNAVRTGIVERKNRLRRQSCVFIDRDGTINHEIGFLNEADKVALIGRSAEALRRLNASRYLSVVVTNQPVIARGEADFADLDEIHKNLEVKLGKEGAYVDGIYYCPHHRDRGFAGEVPELKFSCRCRKPETGMLQDAARDLNIDLSGSWMIGDSTPDIACGRNGGLKTILVKTGHAGADGKYDVKPDYTAEDLYEAIEIILKEEATC